MHVLVADSSLPARRVRPVPFLGHHGEIVRVAPHSKELGTCFFGLVSGQPCGTSARVLEADTSPHKMALLETRGDPKADVDHLAMLLLEACAWLQQLPLGVYVTVSPSGTQRMPRQPGVNPAWLREDALRSGWAARRKAEGYLPLLVQDGGGSWCTMAIPVAAGVRFLSPESLLAWVRKLPRFRQAKAAELLGQDCQERHSEGP